MLSQPSLPMAIGPAGKKRRAAIGVSPAEINCARQRMEDEDLTMLGLRFEGDSYVPPERFVALRQALGPRFESVELDPRDAAPNTMMSMAHSVLTIHLNGRRPGRASFKQVEQRVIALLQGRTAVQAPAKPRLERATWDGLKRRNDAPLETLRSRPWPWSPPAHHGSSGIDAAGDVHALLIAIRDDDHTGFEVHVDRQALEHELEGRMLDRTQASDTTNTIKALGALLAHPLSRLAGDALIRPKVFRAVAEYYGYRPQSAGRTSWRSPVRCRRAAGMAVSAQPEKRGGPYLIYASPTRPGPGGW